ncbi:hypothetical protein AGR1A_Cc50037 [Agrobacterium fabacearum CFBP 5771]|nr:hypothetical protein AGR1A_Cc50037 [Agrobacterium fabacearum CFBP 5771]
MPISLLVGEMPGRAEGGVGPGLHLGYRDHTPKILPVTYMLCNHVLAVPRNNRDWTYENAAFRFYRHRIARLHRHRCQCCRSGALYQPAERGRAGDR